MSISVVSMEALLELNLFDFGETADITPGVTLSSGFQNGSLRMRGVGPSAFNVNAPQSVTVFVDQFAQAHSGTVFTTLLDVQSIEVLRGPQGTLYGQNSPVGVYKIATRKPNTQSTFGYVRATASLYDGDTDRLTQDYRGAINVAHKEGSLGWRLAGAYRDADGFVNVRNPELERKAAGGKEVLAVRSRLLWNPQPDLQLDWTINIQDANASPIVGNLDGQVPEAGGRNASSAENTRFEERDYWGEFLNQVKGDLRDTGLHLSHSSAWGYLDFLAFSQTFDTKSEEGQRSNLSRNGSGNFDLDYALTTLELRASGNTERFDYVAGFYYYDKSVDVDVGFILGNLDVLADGNEVTKTHSVFGNINFPIAGKWSQSFGLRFDDSDTSANYDVSLPSLLTASQNDSEAYRHLSWSSKLRWYLSDNVTAYLAIDNAFKQGGYNPLLSLASAARESFPQTAFAADDNSRFQEESSTAIELGVKGTALANMLRYTVSAYYQSFDDYQLVNQGSRQVLGPLGDVFSNVISNAEEVTSHGAEIGLTYLVGKHWTISHQAAYFDANLGKWNTRFCRPGESERSDAQMFQVYCPVLDEALTNLPKWNGNSRLRYAWRKANWQMNWNVNWSWVSAVRQTRATKNFRGAKHRINASIGGRSRAHGLEVRLWGKNLTNEDFNQDPSIVRNTDSSQASAFRGGYSPGREYGVTLGYRF